jgi:hypothetical protein
LTYNHESLRFGCVMHNGGPNDMASTNETKCGAGRYARVAVKMADGSVRRFWALPLPLCSDRLRKYLVVDRFADETNELVYAYAADVEEKAAVLSLVYAELEVGTDESARSALAKAYGEVTP